MLHIKTWSVQVKSNLL